MRVAFLVQSPWLETLPFVREPIVEFARLGAQVDVFIPLSKLFPSPDFGRDSSISIIETDFGEGESHLLQALARVVLSSQEHPYDLFLATPVNALVVAACASRLMRRPLVSLCDEIYELGDIQRTRLSTAYADSSLCLITDHTRAPLLERSLGPGAQLPPMWELPNCPASNGQHRKPRKIRNRPVRLLSLGLFDRSFGADLIIDSLDKLDPAMAVVVVHERANVNQLIQASFPALRLLEEVYPIDFVMNPVSYDQLPLTIERFDIGLALYTSKSENDNYCGKGSGKLSRYLQHGLPVIVKGPNLRWLEEYGAGKHVDSGAQLASAVVEICAAYERFSARALECYEKHFRLEKFLPPIRSEIDALLKSYGAAGPGDWEAWVAGCSEVATRLEGRRDLSNDVSGNQWVTQQNEKILAFDAEQSLMRALEGFDLFGATPDRQNRPTCPPAYLSNFPADLTSGVLQYGGIYEDAWASESSFLVLNAPAAGLPLLVRGTIPQFEDANFTTVLNVGVDGATLAQAKLCAGEFLVAVEVLRIRSWHLIELAFSNIQRLPSPDQRTVGAKFDSIGFTQPPIFLTGFPDDLARQAPFHLGVFQDGWLSGRSYLVLSATPDSSVLKIRGEVPQGDNSEFTTMLTIEVDGQRVSQSNLFPGKFDIGVGVPRHRRWHDIKLEFSDLQALPHPDGRMIGAKLGIIGFVDRVN